MAITLRVDESQTSSHSLLKEIFGLQDEICDHKPIHAKNLVRLNAVSSRLHQTRSMEAPLNDEIALNIRKSTSLLCKFVETYADYRSIPKTEPTDQNQKLNFNNYVTAVNESIEDLKVHALKLQTVNQVLTHQRNLQLDASAEHEDSDSTSSF